MQLTELEKNLSKRRVPFVLLVPSPEKTSNSTTYIEPAMGQANKSMLSHLSQNREGGTNGTIQQNALVPTEDPPKPRRDAGLQPMGQTGQVGHAKNPILFTALPKELAQLIDYIGQCTNADFSEMEDMKWHVLKFINAQENGLSTALKGFQQLVQECELAQRCNALTKRINNDTHLKRQT